MMALYLTIKGWLVHMVLSLFSIIFYQPIYFFNLPCYFWFYSATESKISSIPKSSSWGTCHCSIMNYRGILKSDKLQIYVYISFSKVTSCSHIFIRTLQYNDSKFRCRLLSRLKQNVCKCYNWLIIQITIKYKHICFCRFVGEIR